jgi:hypothetical protein
VLWEALLSRKRTATLLGECELVFPLHVDARTLRYDPLIDVIGPYI